MINDAQIGDALATVSDARIGDVSEAATEPVSAPTEVADKPVESLPPAAPEPEVSAAAEQSDDVQADVKPAPSEELDAEAQGRLAAESGGARSDNPYDGRTTEGKGWYRGFDSVKADR